MDSVFVGREAELEKAGELPKTARGGTEFILCLERGPAVGKTVHPRAIDGKVREADLPILTSAFVDGQDLPPLWPWRRILSKAASLVEGLTDREIATSLDVSFYTIGNHLRKTYAKTLGANRGETAHWVLAHHLPSMELTESSGNLEAGR